MVKQIKEKLGLIIIDLEDAGWIKDVPYKELNNAIIRQCGGNHNTILSYRNALEAFGLMSEKYRRKTWVINHDTSK